MPTTRLFGGQIAIAHKALIGVMAHPAHMIHRDLGRRLGAVGGLIVAHQDLKARFRMARENAFNAGQRVGNLIIGRDDDGDVRRLRLGPPGCNLGQTLRQFARGLITHHSLDRRLAFRLEGEIVPADQFGNIARRIAILFGEHTVESLDL